MLAPIPVPVVPAPSLYEPGAHWSENAVVAGQPTQAQLAAQHAAAQARQGPPPWQIGVGVLLLVAAGAAAYNYWGE
jgi:hypothetical protein